MKALRVMFIGSLLAFAGACWILPARAAFTPGGSYYTIAVGPDEYFYVERAEPLAAGATPANPYNGLGDPKVIAPLYLESLCRGIVGLLGVDALSFFWAWRLLFPLAMLAALLPLARACLPRTRRPWAQVLRLCAALAAISMLYAVYNLTRDKPVPHQYLERLPTNVEFIIAALLAAAWVGYATKPSLRRGACIALCGAALVYLRPYVAIPWGLCAGITVLWVAVRARRFKDIALMGGLFAAALVPWLLVSVNNSKSEAWQQMLVRYFGEGMPYMVHPRWPFFLAMAALMAAVGVCFRRHRVLFWPAALTTALLPFICALFSVARELLYYDRFVSFYLVVLLAAGLLAVGEWSLPLRGVGGCAAALKASLRLLLLSLAGTLALAYFNLSFPELNQFPAMVEDSRYIPAYRWIRENTPPDALFMVDEGFDWRTVRDDEQKLRDAMQRFLMQNELFMIVARRRQVYVEHLFSAPITDAELEALGVLHRGTFGFPVKKEAYFAALEKYRPQYILWRKTAPIPRGAGEILERWRQVVYDDDVSQIWVLKYQ